MKTNKSIFNSTCLSGAAVMFACLTGINPSAQAADALFIGSVGDHSLTNGSNWVGNTAAGNWDSWVFGSDVVNGVLNLDVYQGCRGITLTSGLTQPITINGPNWVQMSDGMIDMSSAGADLTFNASFSSWGDGAILNVGVGRTATFTGALSMSVLNKNGEGTAVITSLNSSVVINGGTLQAPEGSWTLGATSFTVNTNGTLNISSNVSEIVGLTLNGGTVNSRAGGDIGWGHWGNIILRPDQQITAGGGVVSTIAVEQLGLRTNNIFFVDSASTLNITGLLINSVWCSGSGVLVTKTGNGTLMLSNAGDTYTGDTTISAGTLAIGGAGQLNSGNYGYTIINNGAFVYGSSAAQMLSGVISGTGTITQNGPGTLSLTGANIYSGATTISGGTLTLSGTSANLSAASAVTVASGGHLHFQPSSDSGTYNYNSFNMNLTGQGAGNVQWEGSATVFFGGNNWNTYNLGGNVTVAGGVNFSAYGGANTINLGGVFSGTGDMSFASEGVAWHHFVFSGDSSASGYSGTYKFYSNSSATYAKLFGGNNRLPITATVDLESEYTGVDYVIPAVLDLNSNSQELAGLIAGDNPDKCWVQNSGEGTPVLTINNVVDITFAGLLGAGGTSFALIKKGAGTLTLTGTNNTYTGTTSVEGGTLLVNNTIGSGTGPGYVTVKAGATLGGTGSISGDITVQSEGMLSGTGSFSNVTFQTGAQILLSTNSTQNLKITGTLTLNGSPVVRLPVAPLPLGTYTLATATGGISGVFNSSPIFDSGSMVHVGKIHVVGNQIVLKVFPKGTVMRFH